MDCILCGKCKKNCPAYLIYREEIFSPRGKMFLHKQNIDKELIDFKCFFCGKCTSNCPFDIVVPVKFLNVEENLDINCSDKAILVDTVFSKKTEKLQAISKQKFDSIIEIEDGVKELFIDNDYDKFNSFIRFLKDNKAHKLYFTEKSSLSLAQKFGHKFSFMVTDFIDIKITQLPKEFTRYFSFISNEEFNFLEDFMQEINKFNNEIITDVAFNFGNKNIKFYLDKI